MGGSRQPLSASDDRLHSHFQEVLIPVFGTGGQFLEFLKGPDDRPFNDDQNIVTEKKGRGLLEFQDVPVGLAVDPVPHHDF